jgi:hypothetical protein
LKTIRLFRLLLDLCDEPHWQTAKNLSLTACNLSRLCAGITCRRSSLDKAAAYLSKRLGVPLDASLLQTEVDAKTLLAVCHYIRENRTKTVAK